MGREMDTEEFLQRLRQADMDGDPTEDDLDQLIGTAVRKGRRRVVVRRAIGGVAVAAALAAIVGVGASVVPARLAQLGPASSPTAVPSPTAATSTAPTPSATPGPRLTRQEVDAVIRDLLPAGLTVTKSVGGNPVDPDHSTTIYLTVRDDAGTAYLIIGLQTRTITEPPSCGGDDTCRSRQLDKGTLIYLPAGRVPDKAGEGSQFTVYRSDGTEVFFSQYNFVEGNGPVTRKGLPISDAQAIELVTDPVWDGLAARCRPNGQDC